MGRSTFSGPVNSRNGFQNNGVPIASVTTQAAQPTIATPDATDLATAQALANALKASYNQLLAKLRTANIILP